MYSTMDKQTSSSTNLKMTTSSTTGKWTTRLLLVSCYLVDKTWKSALCEWFLSASSYNDVIAQHSAKSILMLPVNYLINRNHTLDLSIFYQSWRHLRMFYSHDEWKPVSLITRLWLHEKNFNEFQSVKATPTIQ